MQKPERPIFKEISKHLLFLLQTLMWYVTNTKSRLKNSEQPNDEQAVFSSETQAQPKDEVSNWFEAMYQVLLDETNPDWTDAENFQYRLNKIWGDRHLRSPHPRERKLVRQYLHD